MRQIAGDEVRLAEYARLRAEIDRRTLIQQALIALNMTAAGAAIGIVVKTSAPESLLLGTAFISCTFGILWLDHHLAIHQIAGYIKKELWHWSPSWERYLDENEKPLWWRCFFMLAIVLIFGGVSATAVVATRADLTTPFLEALWWSAALLTGLIVLSLVIVFIFITPAKLK